MFLRQQLKAIQKELGEGEDGDDDLKGLKEKLDALVLTEDVRKEIDREWKKLQRLSRESMEAQVLRNYLELVAELPWSARSEEHLDVVEAQRILDEDHYALKDVKDRILEFLAVRQLLGRRPAEAPATGRGRGDADGVAEGARPQRRRRRRGPRRQAEAKRARRTGAGSSSSPDLPASGRPRSRSRSRAPSAAST